MFFTVVLLFASPAQASIFKGETLDTVATIMSWVVLFVVPIVAIGVFWLLHILPEKIAERKHHPQTDAIKTLCLLSLFFGGLLWPLAWLWAYSKPVMYKLAYGTDKVVHGEEHSTPPPQPVLHDGQAAEVERLGKCLAELEGKLAGQSSADARKA